MTAREMHIELDIRGQRMFSEAYDTFLPEEKDWILNMAAMQLTKNRCTPKSNRRQEGFQEVIKRYDDVQELIERVVLPCYIVAGESNTTYSILPQNYLFYDKVITINKENCNNLVIDKLAATSFFTGEIAFPTFSIVDNTPFLDLKVEIQNHLGVWSTLYDINDYLNFSATLTDSALKFAIINSILEVINAQAGIKVRWQKIGNVYVYNKFIFETNRTITNTVLQYYTNVRITIDGNVNTSAIMLYDAMIYSTNSVIKLNKVPARLIRISEIDDVNKHPFAKTTRNSPTVTVEKGVIRVYADTTFIVNEIELIYLRKPRMINLILEQDCDLAEETHTEIVGIAAQLLSGFINSDTYKNIINENLLTE
jgi:hypothetical protein